MERKIRTVAGAATVVGSTVVVSSPFTEPTTIDLDRHGLPVVVGRVRRVLLVSLSAIACIASALVAIATGSRAAWFVAGVFALGTYVLVRRWAHHSMPEIVFAGEHEDVAVVFVGSVEEWDAFFLQLGRATGALGIAPRRSEREIVFHLFSEDLAATLDLIRRCRREGSSTVEFVLPVWVKEDADAAKAVEACLAEPLD